MKIKKLIPIIKKIKKIEYSTTKNLKYYQFQS